MNDLVKKALKKNWPLGEQCHAEIKYYDAPCGWSCYVYAMNPLDENEIKCVFVIEKFHFEVGPWTVDEMLKTYNPEGEPPKEDIEFRRKFVPDLLKSLRKKKLDDVTK